MPKRTNENLIKILKAKATHFSKLADDYAEKEGDNYSITAQHYYEIALQIAWVIKLINSDETFEESYKYWVDNIY